MPAQPCTSSATPLRCALLTLLFIALVPTTCLSANANVSINANAAADKSKINLLEHPTATKTPIDISLGLYLTNLVSIDESRETFEVTGYIFAKWRDPRLQLPPASNSGSAAANATRKFTDAELWTPAIESENSVGHKRNSYTLEVDPNGMVTYTEHFDGTFSTAFSLRQFPFDRQVLRMEYLPFYLTGSEFRFAPAPLLLTGVKGGKYTELGAWQLNSLDYSTDKIDGRAGGESTRAVFQITISRRSRFYIWKVFLPLLLMTLIPAVVFWIDAKEFDWMLKIPMTMLLATVAFEFVVARDLPKIGYMTLLDAIFLASYVFFALCIAEILYVYVLQRDGRRSRADRLHKAARWAYPLSYFAVLALLSVYFLNRSF
jgi:hypothetical protein